METMTTPDTRPRLYPCPGCEGDGRRGSGLHWDERAICGLCAGSGEVWITPRVTGAVALPVGWAQVESATYLRLDQITEVRMHADGSLAIGLVGDSVLLHVARDYATCVLDALGMEVTS